MRVCRLRVALRPEQAVEPAVAQPLVCLRRRIRGGDEDALEVVEGDGLLLFVPRDRIRLAADVCIEPLAGLGDSAPSW